MDRRRTARLAAFALALSLGAPGIAGVAGAGGFAEPVPVLPETGLWADGFTELGYGNEPGLVILWGLDSLTAIDAGRASRIDWSLVPFRTAIQVFDEQGKRVSSDERLVDPPHREDGILVGGFPIAMHVLLRNKGEYRIRLEAYPLIDPAAAGLDSVPHRVIEVPATLTRVAPEESTWQVSDVMVLRQFVRWRAGASKDRTWHDWVLDPVVSRIVESDSAGSFLAFEVQRARELVPHCQRTNCRVAVTIYDAAGGLALQTLRPVPGAFSVSAYIVPIETIALEPGEYEARVEVYEGTETLASERRRFQVRQRIATTGAAEARPGEAAATGSP